MLSVIKVLHIVKLGCFSLFSLVLRFICNVFHCYLSYIRLTATVQWQLIFISRKKKKAISLRHRCRKTRLLLHLRWFSYFAQVSSLQTTPEHWRPQDEFILLIMDVLERTNWLNVCLRRHTHTDSTNCSILFLILFDIWHVFAFSSVFLFFSLSQMQKYSYSLRMKHLAMDHLKISHSAMHAQFPQNL